MDSRPLIEQTLLDSDIEQQPMLPAQTINLIAHLQTLENINSNSLPLIAHVQSIDSKIQSLVDHNTMTLEKREGLKLALRDWLTTVNQKIERYTGKGGNPPLK
jgi:hypothetical protein